MNKYQQMKSILNGLKCGACKGTVVVEMPTMKSMLRRIQTVDAVLKYREIPCFSCNRTGWSNHYSLEPWIRKLVKISNE